MRSKKFLKSILLLVSVFFVFWIFMLGTDYWRTVHAFEKPVFARCAIAYDDGGSGRYIGIAYSIDIKGNFLPEDEFPGVTHSDFYILGNNVAERLRD